MNSENPHHHSNMDPLLNFFPLQSSVSEGGILGTITERECGLLWGRGGDTAAKNVLLCERNWESEKGSDLDSVYIHYCVCACKKENEIFSSLLSASLNLPNFIAEN